MISARLRPYPETKDSGFEWLGEIPAHWEAIPFKVLLARNDSGVWGEDPDGVSDSVVLRSTEQNVDGSWSIDDPALRKLSGREESETLLAEGDLVVTKSSGSRLHIGKTSYVDRDVAPLAACFSNFMQRLRLKPGSSPRLYWYFMNSAACRQQFVFLSTTTTGLGNLNGGIIGAVRIPRAPLKEQQAIANFLDRETQKIDALVEKKERLIKLLREQRTALITHAVTKGLDSDAPMKDSGIEWLGQIPAHWGGKKLKHLLRDSLSYGVLKPDWDDGPESVPLVRIQDVHQGSIQLETLSRITAEQDSEYRRTRLMSGDVVLSVVGSIGSAFVVREELEGANVSRALARIQLVSDVEPRFLEYFFCSSAFGEYIDLVPAGTAQRVLNLGDLGQVPFAIPALEEQRRIIHDLDCETAKINALIAKVQEAIERLKEYRTALISAAVTGKIDVRGLVEDREVGSE